MIPFSRKKFFVDAMVGNIAKKLRLMGFDTVYFSAISTAKILSILKNENRILITKNNLLCKLAQKQKLQVILLNDNDEIPQFYTIKKQLEIKKFSIDAKTSRCTVCNGKLSIVSELLIQDKLYQRILDFTNKFWQCSRCRKVYWEGTHMNNLQNFVRRLNEK